MISFGLTVVFSKEVIDMFLIGNSINFDKIVVDKLDDEQEEELRKKITEKMTNYQKLQFDLISSTQKI
jgi:hypothetical protein